MTGPIGGSGIPAEAVEAAARAYAWQDNCPFEFDRVADAYIERASAVLAAAVPVLLEALAAEIEADATRRGQGDVDWEAGYLDAQSDMAERVRRVAVEWTEGSTK